MKLQYVQAPKGSNPQMTDFQIVSGRQIEFAFQLRQYKQKHCMTWKQISKIASIYGQPLGCIVSECDLSQYADLKRIPSAVKMQAVMNMMNLSLEDLLYFAGD